MNDNLIRHVHGYEGMYLDDHIRSHVKPAVEELDMAIRLLPRVGFNGDSECPFAAQLYVQKESKAAKVADELTGMRNRQETIEEEIMRCERNLQVVEQGSGRIHSPGPGRKISYVHAELKRQLSDAHDSSKQAKEVIQQLERILTYSAKIVHPDVPPVDVPPWTPRDHQTQPVRKPRPTAGANPYVPQPMSTPTGTPFGCGAGSISPPKPIGMPSRADQWILPPPIPHPVGQTDMLLHPPPGAFRL